MQYFYGLLYILTIHFVADFMLQSDWMALNKSKDNRALGTHVLIYTVALLFGAIPLMPILGHRGGSIVGLWVVANGVAHFATDWCTSRLNKWLIPKDTAGKPDLGQSWHWFYVGIGFDQLIHTWTLGLTMAWLLAP